ncbi:MAG: hypothetical protein JXR83_22185 [Deltaproteobacteria bacterium]|nr:hypothetical protein [Deltaproteobacteria bacterium]
MSGVPAGFWYIDLAVELQLELDCLLSAGRVGLCLSAIPEELKADLRFFANFRMAVVGVLKTGNYISHLDFDDTFF